MTPDSHRQTVAGQRIDLLKAHRSTELVRLASQRRVFNRLDWWTPAEWYNSNAFWAVSRSETIDAALLVVPVAIDDMDDLQTAQPGSAWIRWCAVTDGVSASEALQPLFDACEDRLQQVGIDCTFCIVEPMHWLYACLRERGYARNDDVITLMSRERIPDMTFNESSRAVTVRAATWYDIAQVAEVDTQAFEEQWRYPGFVLRRALESSAYFTVAELDGQIVGYQFAAVNEEDAHITRLVVRPPAQGRGIGAMLLADCMHYLRHSLRIKTITLNTQASNTISQRLYARFGFETLQPRLRVMCRCYDNCLPAWQGALDM